MPHPGEITSARGGTHSLQSQLNNMGTDERIPTYAESSATQIQPSLLPQHPPQPSNTRVAPSLDAVEDAPPDYTALDANQTTFMIYGTFIHTPAGPAYQLSSFLDIRGSPFRIRRLRPKEVTQVGVTPLSFDKTYTLYEIHDLPLVDSEYHVKGKRASTMPGVLELKFKLGKWRVVHVPRSGMKGKEILSMKKVGGFGLRTTLNRKHEAEASEWKDAQGRVMATEVLKKLDDGGVVPVIELCKDLDQTMRELLLTVWAARLWVAFGKEKTHALGGRLSNGGWVKLSGAAVLGAGWLGVGGVVAAT